MNLPRCSLQDMEKKYMRQPRWRLRQDGYVIRGCIRTISLLPGGVEATLFPELGVQNYRSRRVTLSYRGGNQGALWVI